MMAGLQLILRSIRTKVLIFVFFFPEAPSVARTTQKGSVEAGVWPLGRVLAGSTEIEAHSSSTQVSI